LQKRHEDALSLSHRMKPEERLVAFFYHSQLIHQMYRAGVRYRSAALRSAKKTARKPQ
jgi:hypothetical protein